MSMLVIREAQISALREDAAARFEKSLADHLRHFSPRESQALGKDGLLSVVRLARQRAEQFELKNRDSIRLYAELMFLLGSGFSTDPQYPWASQALAAGGETQEEYQRADALHSSAISYLHTVMGAKREFVLPALQRLMEHRLRDFPKVGVSDSLIEKLNVIFPEKCAYLGKDRVRILIESATALAEQYGLDDAAAPVLLTILMLLMGHEADRDPIHPWVGATLRETAFMEPSARIETLEKKIWEELSDGMGRFA